MHIAFYSNGWPPSEYPGGINTYLASLSEALQAKGHRVTIVTSRVPAGYVHPDVHPVDDSSMQQFLRKLKDRLQRVRYQEFSYGALIASTFRRIHRSDPVDIIEMEESFGFAGDVQQAIDVPVVVKLHGPIFLAQTQEALATPFIKARVQREGRSLQVIRYVTAPSQRTLERSLEFYGLRPTLTSHLRNPVPRMKNLPMWSSGGCDPRSLLFVGRFDRIKGGDSALLTYRRLLSRYPDLKLLFVGPDLGVLEQGKVLGFHDYVEKHFDKSQQRNISFLGELPQARIQELRVGSVATLVTSVWETGPYTALEAMAQGCPVVAFDTGGTGEIIVHGETGLLAPLMDYAALDRQISVLLEDPECGEVLGRNARQYVTNSHDPMGQADSTLRFYRDVAQNY